MSTVIIANGVEIPVNVIFGRKDYIGNELREIFELNTDKPLTAEQVAAVKASEGITIKEGNEEYEHLGYNEFVKFSTWIAKADVNSVIIKQKEAEIAAKDEEIATKAAELEAKAEEVAEKEARVVEATKKVVMVADAFLTGKPREQALPMKDFIPEWTPMPYKEGAIRKDEGQVYALIAGKAHDATEHPDWKPSSQPSLWFLWHGFSADTALPYVPVTGAHDIYKKASGQFGRTN